MIMRSDEFPPPRQRSALEAGMKVGDETALMGEGAAATAANTVATAASVLTRHVLRDGELILLTLKPSRWFIAISSLRFTAGVTLILSALQLSRAPGVSIRYFVDAGLFAISCRVMWAIVTWMAQLYVLTDQRILRISGVFNIEIFDCPLRKVACVRLVRPLIERMLRLGTIEIDPCDHARNGCAWQTISRPKLALETIQSAMRKAKQGGFSD